MTLYPGHVSCPQLYSLCKTQHGEQAFRSFPPHCWQKFPALTTLPQ